MAAAVAPTADQTSELLQSLSLDSQAKTMELPEPTKKASVDSSNATNGQIQPVDRSLTPLIPDYMDPALCYLPNGYPYYYGGYDGTGNEWDGYPRYVNPDAVEMSPGVYTDNGSLMYQQGYGYNPYAPYSPATSPVPTVGHDGQYYGAQHYQYPTPYFQPFTGGPYTTSASLAKGEIPISAAADQAPLSVDSANANSNGNENGGGMKGSVGSAPLRPAYHNSSFNSNGSYGRGTMPGGVASGYQDPRFAFDGLHSPVSWLDTTFSDGHSRPVNNNSFTPSSRSGIPSSRNHNTYQMGLPHSRPMTGTNSNYTNNGYMNRMYSNDFYSQYGNTYGSGLVFGSTGYQSRTNNRGWMSADNKFKPRGRGSGYYGFDNENMDGLNELNRGPRAKGSKNQKGFVPVALAIKGQPIPLTASNDNEKENAFLVPDREQYNRPDFPETYTDAKFFVIKSYSEDDVHKSVKYNVWSSTPNGNKKLDEAYREGQQKSEGCPIFLFFSVNTSGQFVGMAEMVGPVDFNKKLEYWQQDKWIGCFPLKWHIVKDVPNSLLKHITLENNENKPVTNSRDTQEIKLEQGLQMIKIFKEHSSKQCIIDDFEFYEDRQKRIQDKKAKQQLFQKQVILQACEGKATEEKKKENTNGELKLQKPVEVSGEVNKKATPGAQSNGDVKPAESGSVTISGDVASSDKQTTPSESKTVASHGS